MSNNLVLSLYKHIDSPEVRMYLSRQLYEEALHVLFYLTLLDTEHQGARGSLRGDPQHPLDRAQTTSTWRPRS